MADRKVFCQSSLCDRGVPGEFALTGAAEVGIYQCCEGCRVECRKTFKKVIELKKSGLVIYVHQNNDDVSVQSLYNNMPTREKYDAVILFNTTDKKYERPVFMTEFGQQKVKCFHCRTLIQKVRNLLTEIKCIKGNETIGVCDYCKRSNISNCKRCEYIVSKFMSQKNNTEELMLQYYKEWASKVMAFLLSMLEGSTCEHNFLKGDESAEELRKLLNELKTPLSIKQPDIEMFPFLEKLKSLDKLIESKELIDKLLLKFEAINELNLHTNTPRSSLPNIGNFKDGNIPLKSPYDDISYAKFGEHKETSDKIYKTGYNINTGINSQFLEKNTKISKLAKYTNIDVADEKDAEKYMNVKAKHGKTLEKMKKLASREEKTEKSSTEPHANGPDYKRIEDHKKHKKIKGKANKGENIGDTWTTLLKQKDKRNRDKQSTENKKEKNNDQMMVKMFERKLDKKNRQEKRKGDKTLSIRKVPMLDLPVLQFKELIETSKESVIECPDMRVVSNVMIKGENIVPLQKHHTKSETQNSAIVPLLYHKERDISSHSYQSPPIAKTIVTSDSLPDITKEKKNYRSVGTCDAGVFRFQLSDPDCITKGWTCLPSLKIKRRMNVYKMNPVNPEKNWFKRNENKMIMYEGSEERFANIDDEGYGKLFYKNGRVALDYYKAKEPYAGYRYIVYSDGEPENGVPRPVTVLAVFDGIGNGVVYDNFGCERLIYNQSEGMVIDKSVDSPCKWKWHTLNDPSVMQPVFVDTFSKKSNTNIFEDMNESAQSESLKSCPKTKNADMLTIELENFLKEKADKLLQKLKPFEIKTKTVKINCQFSLRIFQQSDIYLLFREGRTCVKINLGLMLVSNEIVNTETVDVPQVHTSYDRFPPRSESIENIQQILESAKSFKNKLIL